MQSSINDKVRELVRQLSEQQQHCLKELDRADKLEAKVRIRKQLKDLRAGFHKQMDRTKNEPPPVRKNR